MTVADPIAVSALVYFERSGPRDVIVRVVPADDFQAVAGPVYQALPSEQASVVRFVLVLRRDPEMTATPRKG